jgi:hypothetical protein
MAAQPAAQDVQSFLDMTGQTNRQEAILRLKVGAIPARYFLLKRNANIDRATIIMFSRRSMSTMMILILEEILIESV